MARCPECNSRLVIASDVELWDRIFCDLCGTELEVVNRVPLELETVYDFDDEHDDILEELEEDDDDFDWDVNDDEDNDEEW